MACKSDGRAKKGISYSSMKQPPLIKQLRGILSEYPDGGQILKELIQNAEDAEASEFRVMYDERRINEQRKGKDLKFTKFFRGPALCIYNDAVFSDEDWDGIQMVYSSVKEENPLKVGRFGLGFKSVFHITDNPCIVSGKYVLLIDPQQPSDMVNAKIKLNNIESLAEDGLGAAEFWKAFKGMFDFTKEVVKRGYYRGTMMRFPLREQKSKLSEILYTREKVMTLFDSFRAESSSILVFLTSIESITLFINGNDSQVSEVMKIKIQDRNGKIKKQRNKIREDIKEASLAIHKKDIQCELTLSIDVTEGTKLCTTEWLVVNYFVAENVSSEFKRLIEDGSLGYSPTVGVAKPLNLGADTFEGHVFCFLPLPREGSTLTGLPIHVNGYFALSQNRHHLKWETNEQHGKRIDDNAILWNKCLLSEALPRAYEALIQAAIKLSEKNHNKSTSISNVYQCLPLNTKTKGKWSVVEKTLYQRLNYRTCVYQNDKDIWISFNDASFATFTNSDTKTDVQKSVVQCLKIIGSRYVDIPDSVFLTLKRHVASIHDLSSDSLAKLLRDNSRYKALSGRNKAGILLYLFSDKTDYTLVNGLELLPLHSGRWSSYDVNAEKVYICSPKQIELLQGHEGKLMINDPMLGNSLTNHLKDIAKQGLYQLHMMDMETLKMLLQETLTMYQKRTPSELVAWLKKVWHYITEEDAFTHFSDIRIFPLLKKGTWKEPQSIELLKCSDRLLVQVYGKDELSDEVCRCFKNMGITIVRSVPKWIPEDVVKSHLYRPTQKSIVSLLCALGSDKNRRDIISDFNKTSNRKDKEILISYLSEVSSVLTEKAVLLLKELHLFMAFRSRNDTGYETSVSETKVHIKQTDFPNHVSYPFACLSVDNRKEVLLKKLGSQQVTLSKLVLEKLKRLRTESDSSDIPAFMKYIMDRFHSFETNKELVDCASDIPFVKAGSRLYKPSDLFDPSEPSLKSLLQGEHLLPDPIDGTNEMIYCLKRLGLKGEDDVDANIALRIVQTLDKASYGKEMNKMIRNKALELMSLFKRKPKLLEDKCSNGSTLGDLLQNLHFMIVEANRTQSYPNCVKWYSYPNLLCKPSEAKDVSLNSLIGAVMPTVVCSSKEFCRFFGLKTLPCVTIVLRQLDAIKDSCPFDSCSDIVPMLKQVYNFLDNRKDEIKAKIDIFANKMIIWAGDSLVTADKVWVTRTDEDVNLKPYFFKLPKEFRSKESLFLLLGCRPLQDAPVLLEALRMIAMTHRQKQRKEKVKMDRITTRNILERLASFVKEGDKSSCFDESEVLMMVTSNSSRCLKLLPVNQCVYEDDPGYFYEDDNLHFVHEMVPAKTAKILGVKSLSRRALLNAEEIGVKEWGQNEELTTRIKSLLEEGYTDGLSVPKELIQNADDAGASSVKFLYDERQNMKARERVFSKDMEHFQGPALWIHNNALFTDEDLLNITRLNEGTKKNDVGKIGKFGLGFNSVYNLTDLPNFLSGRNIVFFDPHEKYFTTILGRKSKGLKYQLPNKTLVSRYKDQFQPYDGIFGCDVAEDKFSHYNGTLFRLPLRTEQQASESQISSTAYTNIEMRKLLEMFIKTAGNFLLFSQNVSSIEIHHIPANARNVSEQKLLYKLRKDSLELVNGVPKPIMASVLSRIQNIMRNSTLFTEVHQTVFQQTVPDYTKRVIRGLFEMSKNSKTTWLTAWAIGKGNYISNQKEFTIQTAVPISAVAVPLEKGSSNSFDLKRVPLGFYKEGHVFCFLPLPLKTKLPVHINGCFAVTSSRRQLASLTEDDKDSEKNAWNVSLQESVLVFAQTCLLKALADSNLSQSTNYDLWPRTNCEHFVRPFLESFYRHVIVSNASVFKGNNSWVGFQDVTFLDPKISQGAIGQIAFAFLERYPPRAGKTVINMPLAIFECMTSSNKGNTKVIEQAVIDECELFLHFLNKVHDSFWEKRLLDRNKLILAALKFQNNSVKHKMQVIECIPTSPDNRLAKASDLIHPLSQLARLFERNEERFPLDNGGFQDPFVLKTIVLLGMNEHFLPAPLLLNRCDSIPELATRCCRCALDRSINVLKYIYKDHGINTLKSEEHILENIKNSWILPVLQKPKCWPFSWKGSTKSPHLKRFDRNTSRCSNKVHRTTKMNLVLGRPRDLLREQTQTYVGSVRFVLDEDILENNRDRFTKLYQLIGIKGEDELSPKLIVEQLQVMSKEFKNKTLPFKEVSKIHENIFTYLNRIVELRGSERDIDEFDALRSTAVILIGNAFVCASQVAFNIKEECRPHLYRLPELELLTKGTIYKYLGVKEYFCIEDILDVMDILCQKGQKTYNIEAVNQLLINLHAEMVRQCIDYDGIAKWHDRILVPDINGVCWPTHELVSENKEFETSTSMKIMHSAIAPQLGMDLGVRSKQLRCFEDISIGISFGQQERLVTRIKGLLKAYPCGASIMKELLQNADDAGATEIHFIKDYRYHSKERIFRNSSEPLQGPSLCVFNNSYFTQRDIEGIHCLGQGSKSEDPTKTGQYGVGFNAVYHLTDTPSFITKAPQIENGGLFIIFDPLCSHVPKATQLEPGIMCNIDDIKKSFCDHLLGFSVNELIQGDVGTIFRFPLRLQQSDISTETINIKKMDSILKEFEKDMFESVLFLKNITCIKISNITSGSLEDEYTVNVQLSREARNKRTSFTTEAKLRTNTSNNERNLDINPVESVYPMTVADSYGTSKTWIIVQRFGIEKTACTADLKEIKERLRCGDLGLLPVGGVAFPVNKYLLMKEFQWTQFLTCTSDTDMLPIYKPGQELKSASGRVLPKTMTFRGKAFCFLPLPIETGLPMHVHAHFALDHEARRELWKEGYRHVWNCCLSEAIIVPAMISGLHYIAEMIQSAIGKAVSSDMVNAVLNNYHCYFPTQNSKCTEMWTYIVNTFYNHIVDQRENLFPYVFDRKSEISVPAGVFNGSSKGRFRALFTSVENNIEQYRFGIFNSIKSHLHMNNLLHVRDEEADLLQKLLMAFGMKLLVTPNSVREAMIAAGKENIPTASPVLVLSFMKLYNDESCYCDIGGINKAIGETKYMKSENLCTVIRYMLLDQTFHEKVEGLPILLTADGIVKECSEQTPAFLTDYSSLLPGSKSEFVHADILMSFSNERSFQSGCFKRFLFDDFVRLLPVSFDLNIHTRRISLPVQNDDICNSAISNEWLCMFYDFLCTCSFIDETGISCTFQNSSNSLTCSYMKPVVDIQQVKRHLNALKDWRFLPCLQSNTRRIKIPLRETVNLLYLDDSQKQDIFGKALETLPIPTLDTHTFSNCKLNELVESTMQKCVASPYRPLELLQCLVHHRNAIKSCRNLSCEDANSLLAFFSRHHTVLAQQMEHDSLKQTFRNLPFFVTQEGRLVDLSGNSEILVLSEGMPLDGIQHWACECGTILLRKNDALESLHHFLGLKNADIGYVYAMKILPTFHAVPKQHWMSHIIYLKKILADRKVTTEIQKKIIFELKEVAFIKVKGVMKKANELYDPDNQVFQQMKEESDFPPKAMRSKWLSFLRRLGMVTDIDGEMLIEFAHQIETESINHQTEVMLKKARTLFQRFVKNEGSDWDNTTLCQVRTIRFIEPVTIEEEKVSISPHDQDAGRLVCFQGAVLSSKWELCWTCLNLLPQDASTLPASVRNQLGVHESPPSESVVLHCQNVVDALKEKITNAEIVKQQMTSLYEFLLDKTSSTSASVIKQRLKHKHFVHLPEDNRMVRACDIIIDLDRTFEIKPYLFRAPKYYGKYHNLFEFVGSKTKLMFCHYAVILETLKEKCKGDQMHPAEKTVAQRAISGLIKIKAESDESIETVKTVYLPNEDLQLVDSKSIIILNNESFGQRLQGNIQLDIFAGSSFLDSEEKCNVEDVFSKWPRHLQPKRLTDIISEDLYLCSGNEENAESSEKAGTIAQFLHSPELAAALCRLIKHQFFSGTKRIKYDEKYFETEIQTHLQRTRVVEMQSLRTVLKYSGEIVSGSEMDIPYYIKKGNEAETDKSCTFYFKDLSRDQTDNISFVVPGLLELVHLCAVGLSHESDGYVMSLLCAVQDPKTIPSMLDHFNIQPYDHILIHKQDYFPKPGTYVEEKFYPFLEQSIKPFYEYEFDNVAMELDEIESNTHSNGGPVYIYVKIVKELKLPDNYSDLRRIYLVNTGNQDLSPERVPIHRLYRFVRKESEAGNELQRYDIEPIHSRTIDENCLRIKRDLEDAWTLHELDRKRIVRRLLLKWHPDKNQGDKEYSNKVFLFIQIVLSRLENEERITDNVSSEMRKGRSDVPSSSSDYYEQINRRAKVYARSFHMNYESYNKSERTGRYAHRLATRIKHPDPVEANRWLRQAKNDVLAAELMLNAVDSADGHNWICYICHQACEKALKSEHYAQDANNVPRGRLSHNLQSLTFDPEMKEQARLLEERLGNHARLRYPDAVSRPQIPSDIFSKEDAEFSIRIARRIVAMVDDNIS